MQSGGNGWVEDGPDNQPWIVAAAAPTATPSYSPRSSPRSKLSRRASSHSTFRLVPIFIFFGMGVVGLVSMLSESNQPSRNPAKAAPVVTPFRRLARIPDAVTSVLSAPNPAQKPPPAQKLGAPAASVPATKKAPVLRTDTEPLFDHIVVGVIGGRNRSDQLAAAHATWTTPFQNRMFFTDEDVPANLAYGAESVNLFPGMTEEQMVRSVLVGNRSYAQASAHGEAKSHDRGWYISQSKLLLGLSRMVRHHPDAQWFVLADSDTYISSYRLMSGLGLLGGRDADVPMALGRGNRVKVPTAEDLRNPPDMSNKTLVKAATKRAMSINMLLGGAGIVLSRGAVKAMGLGGCLESQKTDITWAESPSDWRLGLCLQREKIPRVTVWHMYQGNEDLTCGYGGAKRLGCAWHTVYRHTFSPCALTWHYQSPEQMAKHFAASEASDKVCQPAGNFATTNCTCRPKSEMKKWVPMLEETPEQQTRLEKKIAKMLLSHGDNGGASAEDDEDDETSEDTPEPSAGATSPESSPSEVPEDEKPVKEEAAAASAKNEG